MWANPQETEEILNIKLFCVLYSNAHKIIHHLLGYQKLFSSSNKTEILLSLF